MTSIRRTNNGWARRNLAMVFLRGGRQKEAEEELYMASMLLPIPQIALEYGRELYKGEQWQKYVTYYQTLPSELQADDRLRMIRAFAAAELGDLDYAMEVLNSGIEIKDLREGEPTLAELWIRIHMYEMTKSDEALNQLDRETIRKIVSEKYPVPAK